MKSNIHAYPDFQRAIKEKELVYLFGTGISSSLTGQRYSWWKWITDGLTYMKDSVLSEEYLQSLQSDDSTDNMIDIVGKILTATKADGTYHDWMKQSFETNPITNTSLAQTLKKLLLTQDVFATTNYDLLLEQATGLGTLSYEEPDVAFAMLDRHISSHVMHIHGVYDSVRKLDNIVADQAQYDAVVADQGAQFIQNILGTRTLIFVGCGKTTEDANISRFIQFARTYLRMDVTYYFLYCAASPIDGLPDNIKQIPYGDRYEDLPLFLEDMAQLRLAARIESNPLVAKTAYTKGKADAYGLSEYHYANECLKFCGRKVELAQLKGFAMSDARISWWAVTGQAGAGKSRLAYELMRHLEPDYFSFFMDCSVHIRYAEQFVPFNNTFIIIDYVKGNESEVAGFMTELLDRFETEQYKLRILLLERDHLLLAGSWYDQLENCLDGPHRAKVKTYEYNTVLASRQHRFLYLEDLDEEAVVELIGDICRRKGLPEDPYRDRNLKEAYARKFEQLRFRPLFLQMYAEAYIDNGCIQVDYQGYQDLLLAVLKKEEERLLEAAGHDPVCCSALLRLLIRAGVTDRLEAEHMPAEYEQDWKLVCQCNKRRTLPGIRRRDSLNSMIRDAEHGVADHDGVIAPLYPDIIRESLFLNYTDEEDMAEFAAELWNNAPQEYMVFLSRCALDFPDSRLVREHIRRESEGLDNPWALEARLSLLQNEVVHEEDDPKQLIGVVQEEYSFWCSVPDDIGEDVLLLKLRGIYLSAVKFIGWSLAKPAFEALERLSNFRDNDTTTPQKISYLLERIHYFTEEKHDWKNSEPLVKEAGRLLPLLPDGREKKSYWLILQREHAVNLIQQRKTVEARDVYDQVYSAVDWTDEHQVELYSYLTFSCVEESATAFELHEMLDYFYELQDMATDYAGRKRKIAFNDKIHYYYLHAKYIQADRTAVGAMFAGMQEYGLDHINILIDEIRGNEMISDFAGILAGALSLKIGYDEELTDEDVRESMKEVDGLLERYPDNPLLAANGMELWDTAYGCHFKKPVPKHMVNRGYMLLLRFARNRDVLDAFFRMLKGSAEAGNWADYVKNKQVVSGLVFHGLTEYLFPTEVLKPRQTVRKEKKIGRNDPCPCGSGLKYKKCRCKEYHDS